MLVLEVARSLDVLAGRLADEVRRRRATAGALRDRPCIVVPNRAIRAYVLHELARRLGIAANLELLYPNGLFARLLRGTDARLLERDQLEVALVHRLAALASRPAFAPVREYVGDAPSAVLRRWQLARRVARSFEDYALTRPDLLAKWQSTPAVASETEAWQRELWLSVFGPEGVVSRVEARDGVRWVDVSNVAARADLDVPPVIHVFGFTALPPLYPPALVRLAQQRDVRVYAFDPGPSELAGPIRELHELWEQLGVARTEHPPSAAPPKVRLLECPSPAREVEIVATEIWKRVAAADARGERLRFHEVAVLIAGREVDSYRSHVAATFKQAHGIPTNLSEVGESRVVEAIDLLLELPLSSFRRQELLKLLVHPNVLALVPDADPEAWLAWADELLVLGGADRADLADTYVERDLHSWDQGLKRLALGAFVSGERSRDARTVRIDGEDYLPLDHAQDESPAASKLLLLARSLIADARFLRAAPRPLADWGALLQRLVETYVKGTNDPEETLVERAARRLRRLEGLALEDEPVPYALARELARAQLEAVGSGGARDLSEGVVVAPFVQGRPLPFRVVFVLGLGEGAFPAGSHADPLDVRGGRRAGDLSPTQRDEVLFLETLAATRDEVVFSYVARDPRTGEPLAPSPLVRRLGAINKEAHPLRRFAPAYFAPPLGTGAGGFALPEAFREAQVRALRETVTGDPERALEGLEPEARAKVEALLGAVAAPPRETKTEAQRVSITALHDFLVSPLQGWAKNRLRLRSDEDEADILLREDEPFAASKLDETVLLRDATFAALAQAEGRKLADVAVELYHESARRAELAGILPTGVFLENARGRHERILRTWCGYLASILKNEDPRLLVHRFGSADDRGEASVLHPALALESAELHGRTSRTLAGARGVVLLVASDHPGEKHVLRGFLEHAVLAASGLAPEGEDFLVFVLPGKFRPDGGLRRGFRPFSQIDARAWLNTLVGDYLGGTHGYLLPFEPVVKFLRGDARNLESEIRFQSNAFENKTSDAWGPIQHRERFGPPQFAERIARRRLGPYVERGARPTSRSTG